MTQAPVGGPAATVYQVASRQGVVGRDAQRVIVVTDGRAAEGGPQQAAYFVTDAEIAAGEFVVTGNKPLPIVLVGAQGAEYPPVAYYNVTGKPNDYQPPQNAPVTPSVPVPLLDLEADTLSLSDGDPVSLWADQSGNGHDFIQTGSERPTRQTIGSYPVVDFIPGLNQWMESSNDYADNLASFTVICAMHSYAYNGGESIIIKETDAANVGWEMYTGQWIVYKASDLLIMTDNRALPQNTGLIVSSGWTAINPPAGYMFFNGADCEPDITPPANPITDYATTGTVKIGRFFDPHLSIYALRIYTPALSSTERAAVEAELAARYGITL